METGTTRAAASPRRILVVRLGAIGDCLRVLPAVARLAREFPGAGIGWAVGSLAAPLLKGHPALARLHVVDGRAMRGGALAAASELGRVGAELAEADYDVAIDFHTRLKSGYLVRASRAPLRIGLGFRSGSEANFLFTNRHVTIEDPWMNRVERFARLLGPLGIGGPAAEWPRGLWCDPSARARAEAIYREAGAPPVMVFPATSAARADDRWPAPRWAEVVARLVASGLRSMVLWGPGDEALAREVAAGTPGAVVAPPTTLPEMLALAGLFRLYAGANTAALHMAWMQGVPSVVVVGGRPWRTDRPLAPVPSVMLSAEGVEAPRKLRGEAARRAVLGVTVDEVVGACLGLAGRG